MELMPLMDGQVTVEESGEGEVSFSEDTTVISPDHAEARIAMEHP